MTIADLQRCFDGAIPAVLATGSADGVPNITYLSRVHSVDDKRIAVSNQFFSKTARNLAENPRAQLIVSDPTTMDEYRLDLVYERTERRGRVFDQLRIDVDAVASMTGMQDVFKLRAADVYRVLGIEELATTVPPPGEQASSPSTSELAELSARIARCSDLDVLVSSTVRGLAEVLGYRHCMLLLVDETGQTLYTIASHGYDTEGVGSEVPVGEGIVGMAAVHGTPMRLGNVRQMRKYSRSVRRSFEHQGGIGPGQEIPLPGLPDAESRLAVPAIALGQVIGVLVVESRSRVAFSDADQAALSVVAALVANAIESIRGEERVAGVGSAGATRSPRPETPVTRLAHVRHFAVDGSTFVDGDYLIKGVAGRILWSLLQQYQNEGRVEFTNREVRRDSSLEMPEFRDNLESRLILLKRRLDERDAPISIEKSGRGRFRLSVDTNLRLDLVATP